jgi:hypothetical protein
MKSSKLIAYIQIIMLTIGIMLTSHGLSRLSWPAVIPWDGGGRFRFGVFLVIALVFISTLTWKFRWNALLAAVLGAVLLAGAVGALWPLLVTFWFALSAAIMGRWLLAKMHVEVDDWAIHFLVGAGVYGTAVGLLAHFPANYAGVYGAALALPIVLGRRTLQQWFDGAKQWKMQYRQPDDRASRWLEIVIAVVALVHLVVAFMPEVGHDALAMHLFIPAQLATRHVWGFDAVTYVWAVMPMLGDWIFSIGYLLGGETAARLINVGFIFVLGWLVRDLVLWAGGTMLGARWAGLIFLSSPLTFTESSSLFIESIWASYVVVGALAVLKLCSADKVDRRLLTVAGLLLGLALAAKAVTFTVLPVLLIVLMWRYKAWLKSGVVATLIGGLALFLIFGTVPYITAWWLTGNPVFPFFNQVFQSPLWPTINFESASIFGKGLTWDILYRVTFESEKYLEATTGAAGFHWLLLFLPASIALLMAGHRRGAALVFIGMGTVFLAFQSVSYLRYVFPAWAMLSAATAVGMTSNKTIVSSLQTRIWSCAAIAAVSLNILFLNAGAYFYRDFALQSLFSKSSRESYLAGRSPVRIAVNLVNALNINRTPVAVLASPYTAGLASDALYASWYNQSWQAAYGAANTEEKLANLLLENRVDFLIVDSTARLSEDQLALMEKVSVKIQQFGQVAVRRLKEDYRFKTELLANPDFSDMHGWSLADGAVYRGGSKTVVASVTSPVVQGISVTAGQRYLNTVVARCDGEKTQGRIQVNWSDSKGRFIRPDIQVFNCTSEWRAHSMEVTAPLNATNGVIYASGQTPTPLEFKSVYFRK